MGLVHNDNTDNLQRHAFDSMSTKVHNPPIDLLHACSIKRQCAAHFAMLKHLETAHSGCLCICIEDHGFIISTTHCSICWKTGTMLALHRLDAGLPQCEEGHNPPVKLHEGLKAL